MVRAEDGSEYTSVALAKGAGCRECGGVIEWEDQEGGDSTGEHCNTDYVLVRSQASTISASAKPAKAEAKETKEGEGLASSQSGGSTAKATTTTGRTGRGGK